MEIFSNKMFLNTKKNVYILFAGILLVTYLLSLIVITIIDQKQIKNYQEKEINSYLESRALTLEYFFKVLKKDIANISENKVISAYFQNKALGMSLRYGLKANISKIDRFLGKFVLSQNIQNRTIFKDILLIDSNKNVILSIGKNTLIDLKNLDILNVNMPIINIQKEQKKVFITKNIFVKGKVVGTLIYFINLEDIFYKLIRDSDEFVLGTKNTLLSQSNQNIDELLENKKYKKYPISNTPFILFGEIKNLSHNSFFFQWFVYSLGFLAIPILYILYHLLLLNNKNIKLKEEIKNSEKEKQNERIILQQSKVAAIGEMIGNIAHQWRQPLSVITTHATGLKLSLEFDHEVPKNELINTMENINEQAQYLSKTIDDFRNFFRGNTNKTHEFYIKNTIENVRGLTKDIFNNNFIEYIYDIEDCKLNGNENILTQALINIYNNSKDILINVSSKDRLFCIKTKVEKDKLIIFIKDSGNGIPNSVIEKVFEPYFTTKHESVGTGIGLYMTNQIITKQFKGYIEVNNDTYSVKGKEYTGACFTITIPLNTI